MSSIILCYQLGIRYWWDIASGSKYSNGHVLVAAVYNDNYIYTSFDYGKNWNRASYDIVTITNDGDDDDHNDNNQHHLYQKRLIIIIVIVVVIFIIFLLSLCSYFYYNYNKKYYYNNDNNCDNTNTETNENDFNDFNNLVNNPMNEDYDMNIRTVENSNLDSLSSLSQGNSNNGLKYNFKQYLHHYRTYLTSTSHHYGIGKSMMRGSINHNQSNYSRSSSSENNISRTKKKMDKIDNNNGRNDEGDNQVNIL